MNLIKSSVFAALFSSVLSTTVAAQALTTQLNTASNLVKVEDKIVVQSKDILMAKLAQVDFFSAQFTQKIFDESGNELQQGSGFISVNKPNLVNWETKTPDESLIVSDGENLWFYDPFVEQVSVYPLANAIANTPILLITNNDKSLWAQYDVEAINESTYSIKAKDINARVKTLELSFIESNGKSELSGFTILDATGQLSVIKLSQTNVSVLPNKSLFTFDVPEGVYIDDQR